MEQIDSTTARDADPSSASLSAATPPLNPGDDAPEGTPGTGEDVCPACGGSGRIDAEPCGPCGGTGKVTVGIGGA